MTLKEVAEKYGMSESSLKNAFPRSQASIEKKYGVRIVKQGRGDKAVYYEDFIEDDQRALTMYEEPKEHFAISQEQLAMVNWDFHVFLGIITTPMLVFRGSYTDFLKYIQAPITNNNLWELKMALEHLAARDYISYQVDKTNEEYFIAALWRKTELDMEIGIEMVCTCKRLAELNNKRSWVPLLKTWLGVEILSKKQPFTMKELGAMIGLSEYQIRESCKVLESSAVFKRSRAYLDYQTCVGSTVDLNHPSFYQLPQSAQQQGK